MFKDINKLDEERHVRCVQSILIVWGYWLLKDIMKMLNYFTRNVVSMRECGNKNSFNNKNKDMLINFQIELKRKS